MPSIAIPSRIASQATRRNVAPRFEDAAAASSSIGVSLRLFFHPAGHPPRSFSSTKGFIEPYS